MKLLVACFSNIFGDTGMLGAIVEVHVTAP